MKKLAVVTALAIGLSVAAFAENIDGTLAVDSSNELTKIKSSTEATLQEGYETTSEHLSAGIDSAYDSIKNAEPASTVPVTMGGSTMLEGPFVGIEGNFVTASDAEGIDESGISFGLRFGAQNIDWRTMVVLERFSDSDDINSYTRALLQIDYYFLGRDNLMIDTYAVRPYAGVNAGGISLDLDSNTNIKTVTYGAQIGATMNIVNNVDFDLGYRYNLSASESIDHTSGITAGIHYKY